MCGIVGFVGEGDTNTLQNMAQSLRYRGPDDQGYFLNNGVGLGHRRLSIIDTSGAGRQPMCNKDETIQIIFNGEIYNFKTLRDELQKAGYNFKTKTDTEVIVYAYEKYGEECFKKFNGMFALAIWDIKKQKLILARDRMGQKPLYYYWDNQSFIFGSELHALLKHPNFKKNLADEHIWEFFFFNCFPAPHTPFQNTFKLRPAEYIVFQNNTVTQKKYWNINEQPGALPNSFKEATQQLDSILNDAVTARLVSDVPLGIFLSGGIDSSTVAWYAQQASTQKIKTFAIGFEEKQFDESSQARTVANHIQSDHHEYTAKADDLLELINDLPLLLSDPIADASILPTTLLSKFTKQHVTVALGGDGADELFCGYPTFQAEQIYNLWKHIPGAIQNGVKKLSHSLLPKNSYLGASFKLERLSRDAKDLSPQARHALWLAPLDKEKLNALLRDGGVTPQKITQSLNYAHDTNTKKWHDIIAFYLNTYLAEQVLQKVDRASMLNSLEVRAPFLDHRVAQFAHHLPLEWKIKHFTTKHILKKLMMKRLPESIINRKKHGFAVPLAKWFQGPLKEMLADTLSKNALSSTNILDSKIVNKYLSEHIQGKQDHHRILWNMLVWQLWIKTYIS